jgi:peptidyl-prolyl cis-trans isomerase C
MRFNLLKLLVVVIMGITFISPGVQAQNKEVLAKIGTKAITTADINRVIGYYDPEQRKEIERNPQIRENILWQIVRGTVVSQLARKKGFDKKPEVRIQQEMLINNFLATLYLQKEIIEKITVSEAKARSYYKDHPDDFRTPEMIRVKHILIKTGPSATEDEKKKAKMKAEEVLKSLKAGGDFSKLASEASDDPGTKDKGGDLDFFPRGTMIPAFEEAAFALKPAEISGLVETEYGFHIIRMEEKKEAFLESYEKIKEKVKEQALQKMRDVAAAEFIEKAMKDARVEINPGPAPKAKK